VRFEGCMGLQHVFPSSMRTPYASLPLAKAHYTGYRSVIAFAQVVDMVHKLNSVSWPLPGHPEAMKMEPSPRLFSQQCLEGDSVLKNSSCHLLSPVPGLRTPVL